MSRRNQKKNASKKRSPNNIYIIPQRRQDLSYSRTVSAKPFVDAPDLNIAVTTTVTSLRLFNAMQQILTSFPQHATPTVSNISGVNTPGLRTRIKIHHIDVDITTVGAQATVLLSGDLYNTVRFAYVLDGRFYDGTGAVASSNYLTSITGGTNITDVVRVLHDERVSLSSTAFDSTNGYNVPRVVNKSFRCAVNRSFVFYSTNASYTSWSTEANDIVLNVVSDSSATPHPTFSHNTRIFFTFENY